ncbi:hypothetical protein L9W92_16485 [Pelotomaculum terephthalicicum JT]|uniref:hypothetical protein n=1 Tax=Pelotomaculum terephthalicicum TaxID=206393 RepID=UPI0009D450A5|nr:hypothetical protein [Pelotomaculum terephthalicicum]MCG9969602.1 hypothetical protein [Pelotomaculum terephthalicicum JT]OPY58876.1 MAG: hypothetical protein A4E56_03336 [Pelotomaculum sp. PtaU1.Bin065]
MCFEKNEGIELCEVRLVGASKSDLKKIEDHMKEVSTYVLRKEEYFYLISSKAARFVEEKASEVCGVFVGPARIYPDPELNE